MNPPADADPPRPAARRRRGRPLPLAGCATPPGADTPPADRLRARQRRHRGAVDDDDLALRDRNGWPRERLHAIDLPYPLARDDDDKAQPGRSSAAEHTQYLAAEVEQVLRRDRRDQGRAGRQLARRQRDPQLRRRTAAARPRCRTRCSAARRTTASGRNPAFLPGSEFNGAGPFLTALNAPRGRDGNEVTPGVRWLTIRSDNNDKFAQPDGVVDRRQGHADQRQLRRPGAQGRARTSCIAGIDHRETSFSAEGLRRRPTASSPAGRRRRWRSRRKPARRARRQGQRPRPGQPPSGNFATNLPLVGATVEVYRDRRRPPASASAPALHRQDDRRRRPLGPVRDRRARARYEFVDRARRATRPRTSTARPSRARRTIVHLRAERLADADRDAGAVVTLTPAARLLRRAARPHRARRQEPAGRHPARRGRRVRGAGCRLADASAARRRRRVQRRAHRRPRLAGGATTTSCCSSCT